MDSIDKIIELMNRHGVSAAKLTREANLTNGLMTQWKQGKQKPSLSNLQKVADYFNVSVDYLLGNTDNPTPLEIPPELNDVQVAFSGGVADGLTQADIDMLLDMARVLKERKQKQGAADDKT